MKRTLTLIAALLATAVVVMTASAHWPTTLEQNVPVAAMPYTIEKEPEILAYPDDEILVSWYRPGLILCYQIIDKFGNIVLNPAQRFIPTLSGYNSTDLFYSIISDQRGGAIAVFTLDTPAGHFAQRLDSLGNRLWGDDGVQVFWYREPDFNIAPDGKGGFWLGVIPDSPDGVWGKYWIQHVDSTANLAFGDSGRVAIYTPEGLKFPLITEDGAGGCFISWEHGTGSGPRTVYMQHIDDQGNNLWSQPLFVCDYSYYHDRKMIYDGEGGVIYHSGYNIYRINGSGQIIWSRTGLGSPFNGAVMLGDAEYFYTGSYDYENSAHYGHRYDFDGIAFWPEPNGLVIFQRDGYLAGLNGYGWHYKNPYFYAIFGIYYYPIPHNYLVVQRIDRSGTFSFGEFGLQLTNHLTLNTGQSYKDPRVLIDKEGGIRAVWCYKGETGWDYDIYAKRSNIDGALGGPFPLTVNLTQQNPPILIPHTGGSFNYDLTIIDRDSIGGEFDRWITLTYPNGTKQDLSDSLSLQIEAEDSLVWNDLTQYIPGSYPHGTYTFTVFTGKYPYHSSWGDGSFIFEKLPDTTGVIGNGNTALPTSLKLTVIPNPFNNVATIRLELPVAGKVTLEIFDINGRRVGVGLNPTRFEPGIHEIPFDGSDLPSGIYIVRMTVTPSGSGTTPTILSQKMTVLK
jgi:hypothetical protein